MFKLIFHGEYIRLLFVNVKSEFNSKEMNKKRWLSHDNEWKIYACTRVDDMVERGDGRYDRIQNLHLTVYSNGRVLNVTR